MSDLSESMALIVLGGVAILVVSLVGAFAMGTRSGAKKAKPETYIAQPTEGDPRATGRFFTPTLLAEPQPLHTHTYKVNSEHTDQGRRVVVKKCETCGDVIREMD